MVGIDNVDRVGECESRQLGLVHRDPTSWVMLRILPHYSAEVGQSSGSVRDRYQSYQSQSLITNILKLPLCLAR
jgi:hypothetical protein